MFNDKKNLPENDPLQGRFDGMDRELRAPAALKQAAKTGVPLRTGKREGTAVHVRRFGKAIVAYAVGVMLVIGVTVLIPWMMSGTPNTNPAGSSVLSDSASSDATTQASEEAILSPPKDFSFSITFNVFGISSYNSETGRLVKTNDPANPDLEKYATTLFLNDEQLHEIYQLLMALDWRAYDSEDYRLTDASSKPSQTWRLIARAGDCLYVFSSSSLPIGTFEGRDEKAQAFIDAFTRICEIITSSEEWKALPDPEVLYS